MMIRRTWWPMQKHLRRQSVRTSSECGLRQILSVALLDKQTTGANHGLGDK